MNHIIERLQEILSVFTKITTAVICVTAAYIVVFWGMDVNLDVNILWQILIASGLGALGIILLPTSSEEAKISRRSLLVRMIAYYVYINIEIFLCGFVFEWFYVSNWRMLLGLEVCIIAVFIAVTAMNYFINYKLAEKMNRKLQERE